MNKARRVADRTSAIGGQAREGLSAGLIGSGERPKSDLWYFYPSPITSKLNFGLNQDFLPFDFSLHCGLNCY